MAALLNIFLFGQSDFQVSKTIFDSREILFLELLLLFWSSCYFLELLLGSSIWWRELGETPSANSQARFSMLDSKALYQAKALHLKLFILNKYINK